MPRPVVATVMELSAWTVTWNLGAETGHGLVDGVVNDLPHQVMQTAGARRADIHARRLRTASSFENLNLAAIVIVFVCHTSSFSQENVYSLTSLS